MAPEIPPVSDAVVVIIHCFDCSFNPFFMVIMTVRNVATRKPRHIGRVKNFITSPSNIMRDWRNPFSIIGP